MKFYKLSDDYYAHPKWAFAGGYGPIASNISGIPFLAHLPEAIRKQKMEFWRINDSPPGIEFEPGGKEWPDVLGCGGGPPHFFVSEKIVNDLRDFGIDYLRATEMPLVPPFPKKLRDLPLPRYYVLEAIPGLKVAWAAMGIPHDTNDNIDLSGGYPRPWPPSEWKVRASSWRGQELMSYSNWQSPSTLVCTDEIKEIAQARKWTNIMFHPLTTVD